MKKWICMLLACALTLGCAFAEGLLPGLDEVYGVGMPSLYTLLNRYPDAYEETEAGVEETWEGLTDAEFTAFGEHLSASGCEMLNYTSEDGIFEAEVGKDGKSYRFVYDGNKRTAMLVFPFGTYDDELFAVENAYQDMLVLIESGEYEQAYDELKNIRGYKDTEWLLENDDGLKQFKYKPGNTIIFGSYEQDGITVNGAEAIEWLVLENDGENALLISRYALDCKPYNEENTPVTWETCSLRKWLNEEFLNVAFTEEEQRRLKTVTVTADKNHGYDTNPGNDTQDRVYLLSITEAKSLFTTDRARMCQTTAWAEAQGAFTDDNGNSLCWLRSPGSSTNHAAIVNRRGRVGNSGNYVNKGNSAVRPVVVLHLQ